METVIEFVQSRLNNATAAIIDQAPREDIFSEMEGGSRYISANEYALNQIEAAKLALKSL